MKPLKDNPGLKYSLIGSAVLLIIILVAVYYNNYLKKKAAEAAKQKSIADKIADQIKGAIITDLSLLTQVVAYNKASAANPVKLYTTDGNFDFSYSKTVPGEFVGIVIQDHTDNTDDWNVSNLFYKISNSGGGKYYVAKAQVVKK